jgi:cell shape-determining protein MreC
MSELKENNKTQSETIYEMATHNRQEINAIKSRIHDFGHKLNSLNHTDEEKIKEGEENAPADWYRRMLDTLEEENNSIQSINGILDQLEKFI